MLGVAFGTRRIGLAVSDPTGTVATPLETLARRTGKRPPLAEMERIGKALGVEHVVVGLPLDMIRERYADIQAQIKRAAAAHEDNMSSSNHVAMIGPDGKGAIKASYRR